MTSSSSSGNVDREALSEILTRFQKASSATMADRAAKDQILDELQEAVGLSGKMVTEAEVVRRAAKILQGG